MINFRINSTIKKDLVLTLSTQLTILLTSFILNKIVSTNLGVEGYAGYTIIKKSSTILIHTMMGGLGIALPHITAMLNIKGFDNTRDLLLSNVFRIVSGYVIFIILSFLFFPSFFSNLLFGSIGGKSTLPLSLFYAISMSLNMLYISYFRGLGDYKKHNYYQIITQILVIISTIIFSKSIQELFISWSIVILLYTLFLHINSNFSISEILSNKYRNRKIRRWLFNYGFPRMLSDILLFSSNTIPLLIILKFYGDKSVGLFSAAISIQILITPIFSFPGKILLQKVSEAKSLKQYDKVESFINQLMIIYIAIATAGSIFIYFTGEWLLKIFFTAEFLPALKMVQILSISLIPRSLYLLLRNPIDAISSVPYNLFIIFVWLVTYVFLLYQTNSPEECAWVYLYSSIVLGIGFYIAWKFLIRQNKKLNTQRKNE